MTVIILYLNMCLVVQLYASDGRAACKHDFVGSRDIDRDKGWHRRRSTLRTHKRRPLAGPGRLETQRWLRPLTAAYADLHGDKLGVTVVFGGAYLRCC